MPLESLQNDIETIRSLKEMTSMLEQLAAREISQMRGRILDSRPFFQEAWKIYRVLRQVAPVTNQVSKKDLVILITLNWGMSGNLLNRVLEKGEALYTAKKADLLITGKMGQRRFLNRDERTVHFFEVPTKATYEDIEPLKKIAGQYSQVHIVFPRYYRASQQMVETVSLILSETDEAQSEDAEKIQPKRFIIEPDVASVSTFLNQTIVGILFFSYFSEAILAYSAAQMIAMRNAHDNAKDEEARLTNLYQRARRELVDAKLREQHEFRFVRQKKR